MDDPIIRQQQQDLIRQQQIQQDLFQQQLVQQNLTQQQNLVQQPGQQPDTSGQQRVQDDLTRQQLERQRANEEIRISGLVSGYNPAYQSSPFDVDGSVNRPQEEQERYNQQLQNMFIHEQQQRWEELGRGQPSDDVHLVQKYTSSNIDEMVEHGIREEVKDTNRPTRRARLARSATTGRAADARERFDYSLRDGYAELLGVGKGGQVHHAIELQVLDRYPGTFTEAELNAFNNMRGIPSESEGRRQLHNSKIREVLDRHYRRMDQEIAERNLRIGTPAYVDYVRSNLSNARDEVDYVLGQFFSDYRTDKPRAFN
jgi:hypothetical protein